MEKNILEKSSFPHQKIELNDNGEMLIREAKKYKMDDAFTDQKRIDQSNSEWKAKRILLKKALMAGHPEAQKLLFEEIEGKKYNRDLAHVWVHGHEKEFDVKMVRAFYWEQLSMFDQKERNALIEAYKEGEEVDQNLERSEFWRNYKEEDFQNPKKTEI